MAIKILVVAEHGNDQLRPVTANAVAAAVALGAKSGGAEVHVLVAGHGAQVAAGAAATIIGPACRDDRWTNRSAYATSRGCLRGRRAPR